MRNKLTPALLAFAALLCGGASAEAQNPAALEEEQEIFISIKCGPGWSIREHPMPDGEVVVVEARKYGSVALADAAGEHRLWSADEVIARAYFVDEKGRPRPRDVARFGSRVVRLERDGEWLYSTEVASLESLLKFEAYEERQRRGRPASPPEK
jgi:hypothetical protein